MEPISHDKPFNMGYTCIVTPYPYTNGATTPIQVSMVRTFFNLLNLSPPHDEFLTWFPFFCNFFGFASSGFDSNFVFEW